MTSTKTMQIAAGPSRWDLLQSMMHIIDSTAKFTMHLFTFEDGSKQSLVVTSIGQIKRRPVGPNTRIAISGYITRGVSPYEHHGTPFEGEYDPVNRSGQIFAEQK